MPKISSATVARVISRMENKNGRGVDPETLVNEARNPKHPLHPKFIWDDSKAAHQHRLDTAREIIASVRVQLTYKTHKINCVAYVRDPAAAPDEQGYVSVRRLRSEAENAAIMLETEVNRITAALERARELAVALNMLPEFDRAWEGAKLLGERLRRGPSHIRDDEDRPIGRPN